MPVHVKFKNRDCAYLSKSAACKKLVVPLITFIFDIAQIKKTKTGSNSHTFAKQLLQRPQSKKISNQ